jgi:uncharacterized protein (TIGR03790 family)
MAGCKDPLTEPALPVVAPSEEASVLVVINQNSPESMEIGSYYARKRNIPKENVVFINVQKDEEIGFSTYLEKIEGPVKDAIKKKKTPTDYIVLTRGTPIRIAGQGYSVDGQLVTMDKTLAPIGELNEEEIRRCQNPYLNADEPFSRQKFGIYLVTRLTGYSVADAKGLVDRSLAAKPDKGPFFFDGADNRRTEGYGQMQGLMVEANSILRGKGFESSYDDTAPFLAPAESLMGYCSWGSNDGAFDRGTYNKLRFKPGSIAETYVSTSGRSFEKAVIDSGGQSAVGDLIHQGLCGVKGYVSEPYTFALARPEILFARYTSGRNLAESFYAASQVIKWKDMVIGDPLCRPYAKR